MLGKKQNKRTSSIIWCVYRSLNVTDRLFTRQVQLTSSVPLCPERKLISNSQTCQNICSLRIRIKPEGTLQRYEKLFHENRKICIVSQQLKTISFKKVISAKYHKAMLKRKRANKKIMLFNDWRNYLSQTISNTRILLFSRLSWTVIGSACFIKNTGINA